MKQIKFRAWDAEEEKMIETFDGNYRILVNEEDGSIFCGGNMSNGDWTEPVLMQFTGLLDKNGVEIYEGDLLSDPFPIDEEDLSKGYYESFMPVVWCLKTLQWCVDALFAKDGSYLTSLVEYFGDFLEVKGNIYENPELINDVISHNGLAVWFCKPTTPLQSNNKLSEAYKLYRLLCFRALWAGKQKLKQND